MNWQEFEDRLKADSQAHQTPVDTDALWNRIRAKKRRRVLLFWWCFGVAALAGSSYLVATWLLGNGPLFAVKTTGVITSDTIDFHKNSSANVIDSAYLIQTQNTRNTNRTAANHKSKIINQPSHPSNSPLDPAISNTRSISTIRANKSLSKNNSHPSGQRLSTKAKNKDATAFSGETSSNVLESNNLPPKEISDSLSDNIPHLLSENPSENDKPVVLADSFSSANQTLLPWLPKNMMLLVSPSVFNKPLWPVPLPIAKKRATNKPNHFYIGLQAGYYQWKIQADSARTGENPLTVLQTGLQVQLPLGPSWSVRTGIQYAQWNAVFRWADQWEEIRKTPVLSYYVNGNIDTAFTNTLYRYERQVQHYNHLQSISIPVDIQYRIPLKNWNLRPSAGVQIQVWQRAAGVILHNGTPDAQVYPGLYQRAFNVGLRGGISLEVPLGQRTRFVLEPAAMLDVSRRTKNIYPAERFQQWGVNVGVVRRW